MFLKFKKIFRISPSPFSQKESFSKTYPSFLTVKEGVFFYLSVSPARRAPPFSPSLSFLRNERM